MDLYSQSISEQRLSIIVPVYNVAPYLARCVHSILNQTHQNLEIILVDDGSTDASGALCDAYSQKDHRVRVIHQPNKGLSAARNTGLSAATGIWIGFVDSDDWIAPDMYECLLDTATALTADVVYGDIIHTNGQSTTTPPRMTRARSIHFEEHMREFFRIGSQKCIFYVWNGLYRRDLALSFRFREEIHNAEDVDYTFRIALASNHIARDERARYFYFQNPQSITRRDFSATDLDLLNIWDYIISLCQNNLPEYLPWARLNRYRTDFTLLTRLILRCEEKEDAAYAKIEHIMLNDLKTHSKELLSSPIPHSRKMLIRMMCINYPATKRILRILNKLRKKEGLPNG